jgi:hypothetical protein
VAEARVDPAAKLALAAAVVLTLLGAVIGSAGLAWLIAPLVFALACFAMSRVPLRHSLLTLMLCALVLENPNEVPAYGVWQSPLYMVGALVMVHLNQNTGVSWMSISGLDAMLLFLCAVAFWRRRTGSQIDGPRHVPTPKILIQLAFISLAGTAFIWLWGMLRGGDFGKSLWQVEKVTYLPILFLLFHAALRGPQDFPAVGKVILVAAFLRALLAIYVVTLADTGGVEPEWATTHHDSMLFACAVVIIVSLLMHRAPRALSLKPLLSAPILLWGMVANNRRAVWVQIVLVFTTLYFAIPMTPAKRKIKTWAVRLAPLVLMYVALGWRIESSIFKPVHTLRSVVSPATDVSTMTRDIENYCIAQTIRSSPILGLGYGHRFFELIPLPAMPHPLELWLPHNSLLGLWFAAGFVGYTAMTLPWTAGVYLGVRAYRFAKRPLERSAALVSFAAVLIYLIQCYADLGLGAPTGVFMVAAALAIAGKLAVATGAWTVKGYAPPHAAG